MLFNSHEFIFVFLPMALAGFFILSLLKHSLAVSWLGLSSLVFYGWLSRKAVPLLIISIGVNYYFGFLLARPWADSRGKYWTLVAALVLNLSILGIFKYADFFIGNVNGALAALTIGQIQTLKLTLPIGISFFTFTQIAFLVDCYEGKVRERSFANYFVFVTYFPHLVAGPVIHHAQLIPQLRRPETFRINYNMVATGLTIFVIGLSKKMLLADPLSEYADKLFTAAGIGAAPMLIASWSGVLAYTFQIYFDFSGYSDMAIGLSLLFGIHLPINFNSPYKATSIIDFWRRWHISLSTFLRDYLYIRLGGNKFGEARRFLNIFITMLLGGLWHGASWTFVLWGALHGLYLVINHAWRALVPLQDGHSNVSNSVGWLITFPCICFAWVLFRSERLASAANIFQGMLGMNGIGPEGADRSFFILLALSFFITLGVKNCAELFSYSPYKFTAVSWKPDLKWAITITAIFAICVLKIGKVSPFLYFQF